ncbi:hypothetical protein FPV67DRAFT_1675239 [Lyophyllum atratum]|nr:hypothetical protein FPV67DRAFT_1675239 [Lyophyllum atratum]
MSAYPTIPQEIIDKIINALEGPVPQMRTTLTLISCCTVSSSFCNAAQKMLYRSLSVSLARPSDAMRTKALEDSLMSSSRLSNYVDSISILIDPSSGISFSALPRLIRLRSIMIMGTSEFTEWSSLPDIFKHELYTVIGSPALHEIALSSMFNFPISYFCASPCLKKLEVWRSVLLDDTVFDKTCSPPPSIEPKRKGSLQTLIARENAIYPLGLVLGNPLSPLNASGLRTLAVKLWNEACVIGLKAVLGVATSSLEELHIATSGSLPVDSPEMGHRKIAVALARKRATSVQAWHASVRRM